MRVCCHINAPFSEAPVAGLPVRARMEAAVAHLDASPLFEDTPEVYGEVLWLEGLFPLLTAQDLDAFLAVARHKGQAFWGDSISGIAYHQDWPKGASYADIAASASPYSDGPVPMAVTDGAALAECNRRAFAAVAADAMAAGVILLAPETTWIEATVLLTPGAIVEPNAYLAGATTVAAGARISMGSHITDSTIGPGTLIKPYTVMDQAQVGADVTIGPFAHIRPNSVFEDKVKVGNFVETKKSHLGVGSKASHLTYLGDANIGKDCNIGAGTITCNYDGFNKHLTQLGDGVFVGSNSSLVAPVHLAEGAFVAAGSCITEDVPKDNLALARGRQRNKDGLAAKIRDRAREMKEAKKKSGF